MTEERDWARTGPGHPEPSGPIRPRAFGVLAGLGAVALVGWGVWLSLEKRTARAVEDEVAVSASQSRLTLAGKDDEALREIGREGRPDVYYRVTLKDVPLGRRLSLTCDWLDPAGQTVRQNHYETRPITSAVWNTHCHQRYGPESASGAWTVRLVLGARTLKSDSFTLK